MVNLQIAEILEEVADLLEIQGANPFRIRAYRNAAQTLRGIAEPVDPAKLTELPGIGKDLAGKIGQIITTGDFPLHRELLQQIPRGVVMMTRIPALGPHRARKLYEALKIESPEELAEACRRHKVSKVPGFGPVLEGRILENIPLSRPVRMLLSKAERDADRIVRFLRETPGLERIDVVGSFRRRVETVGDLDLLAVCTDPDAVLKRFTSYSGSVTAWGPKRAQIRLNTGLAVDLRVFARDEYGAALHYFTGAQKHNIAVRLMGKRRGLLINEYGIFKGRRRIGGAKEEDVFTSVGLPWIPPEIRTGGRELQLLETPRLVELGDLKGDLQLHTQATDGRNTLEEIVDAARARGYAYAAITDHSQNVRVARGLTPAQGRELWKRIDALNVKTAPFRILKGVELDILPDGSLDWPAETLQEADWVLGGVHMHRTMTRSEMTRRLVRAVESGYVHAIAHPTGRLIHRRPPIEFDLEAVIDACLQYHVALEIDGQPDRLDLNAETAYRAQERGVRICVNSDAHAVGELDYVRYGIYQARRAWIRPAQVLNALPLSELMDFLHIPRRLI